VFEESVAVKMALFLKSKRREIHKLIERADSIVISLQKHQLEYVLCHADIHGWNLLIDKKDDAIYVIDWDTIMFGPKERDLMFVGAGIWDSGYPSIDEENLFYKGYGETQINHNAIEYYRCERIIQDIKEYCEQIFLSNEGGEDREQSLLSLQYMFLQNRAVDIACKFV
jgi:spectinomycin phosphotransferase